MSNVQEPRNGVVNLAFLEMQPKRAEFLVFGAPLIEEEEIREVEATLRSGWLGTGPKTKLFEQRFAEYTGAKFAVALNSATAGLHLALDALGIGPGDEVIVPTMTFAATANVVFHVGATPVFADCDPTTFNIDPASIAAAITPRTKAIIPVHFAGRPCDMDAIMAIAQRHGLKVIEDAAHATETWYKGRKVGTIGDVAAFSFYSTKNIVTGEGGMVTTNDPDLADAIRIRSLHGISRDAWKRYSTEGYQPYDCMYPGYKYNMMDLQASLGIHQLAKVDRFWARRDQYWAMYNQGFASLPELTLPPADEPDTKHARHLYTLILDIDQLTVNRNEFVNLLKEENIGSGVHFVALHLHSLFRERLGTKRGDFPGSEYVSDRTISLPLSPKLTEADVQDVIAAVHRVIKRVRR
ncbi:MAG: Glutamine--scyllo-inositol transaminase [Cyanobacteria bacterium RYN_339]|nr:Glutamine--scyllo-inositol transaminase [Cyanobacteria bacterium RYN_339]